ncbi:MAG: RHS repeat-associated core domain-containing protein, partial [Desulfococcaceae bacterium]
ISDTSGITWNDWNMTEEITRVNGSDSSRYFVWGLDLSQSLQGAGGIGGLLSMADANASYHYLYDANGNVGQLINTADGTIAAHYEYDPFGNFTAKSGAYADANPFRFSTKYFDADTGLYDFGLRDYSANLGRWTSRDPIGEDGGLNIYGFVGNSPINKWDRLGLIWGEVVSGAGAGIQYHVSGQIVTKIKGIELYISGSPNPATTYRGPKTSILHVWRSGNKGSNLLRLDFHSLPTGSDTPGQWHWNVNELDVARRIGITATDHTPSAFARYAGKTLKVVRYAGKAFLIAGMANTAFNIYAAENRKRQIVIEAGGWTGAIAGAWAGGKVGAAGGGAVGSFFGGGGAGPGAIVGGIGGSIAGGVSGFLAGENVTEYVYDKWFEPVSIEQYTIATCQDTAEAGGDI